MATEHFPYVLVMKRAAKGFLVQIGQVVPVDRVLVKDLPVAVQFVNYVIRPFLQVAGRKVMRLGDTFEIINPGLERLIRIRLRVNKDKITENTDSGFK